MVWFTADFHLGHSNIIHYCGRPFASASEMDEEILVRVNECVKPEDELYFLGDFCIGGPKVALALPAKDSVQASPRSTFASNRLCSATMP